MLPEIISFRKSLELRLEEYQELLENIEAPCSDIIEVWSSIFEDIAHIEDNWEALWILSVENCKKYKLLFPTAVIVRVNELKWQVLAANVGVIAVQEDIVLPSQLDVSIMELHPIKSQDYDECVLRNIENWLDKCRFFFKNLWYPWDAELNVSIMDWCDTHLKNRLLMHYDIQNGVFGKTVTNYLKLLLQEAHRFSEEVQKLNYENNIDERLATVKKYLRKKLLEAELDLFEDPELRYGMILLKRKKEHFDIVEQIREARFVWKNGSCESLFYNLKNIQNILDRNTSIKIYSSLQEALDSSNTNDIILLPVGVFSIGPFKGLESGGIIKGLDAFNTVIVPDMSIVPRAILLECYGCIELENLTLNNLASTAVQVFSGIVKIKKCRLISSKNDSTTKGIVLVTGSKLILEECELQGFASAISMQEGTSAKIINSRIFNCNEGIKVTTGVSLSLHCVDISFCATYGIRMESSKVESEDQMVGDLNLLEDNALDCQMDFSSVTFDANEKGNVVVKKSEKDIIVGDSFSESIRSPETVYLSENEDSDM